MNHDLVVSPLDRLFMASDHCQPTLIPWITDLRNDFPSWLNAHDVTCQECRHHLLFEIWHLLFEI